MCSPKDMVGLSVLNLEFMNIALLAKLIWKLGNDNGVSQDLPCKKYLKMEIVPQSVIKCKLCLNLSRRMACLSFGMH